MKTINFMVLRTVIFGAGHNGAVVAWNNKCGMYKDVQIVGFIDDNKKGVWAGLPIIGESKDIENLRSAHNIDAILVTAIADPKSRLELCDKIRAMGYASPSLVPLLPPWIEIGDGVYVDERAVLHGCNIKLGDYSIVGPGAYIEGDVELGRGTIAMAHSFIAFGSKIGDASCVCQKAIVKPGCLVGRDCYIHPARVLPQGYKLADGEKYPSGRATSE